MICKLLVFKNDFQSFNLMENNKPLLANLLSKCLHLHPFNLRSLQNHAGVVPHFSHKPCLTLRMIESKAIIPIISHHQEWIDSDENLFPRRSLDFQKRVDPWYGTISFQLVMGVPQSARWFWSDWSGEIPLFEMMTGAPFHPFIVGFFHELKPSQPIQLWGYPLWNPPIFWALETWANFLFPPAYWSVVPAPPPANSRDSSNRPRPRRAGTSGATLVGSQCS